MKYAYEDLNHSELEMLARQHGLLAAHRGLERSLLIGVIEGDIDPADVPGDPIDVERDSMMYMKEMWPDVHHQLSCFDENFACWDCPPGRAVCCAIEECEPGIIDKVRRGDV